MTESFLANFPNNLKTLREEKDLEIEDVAKDVGVSSAELDSYESGLSLPSIEHLNALAQLYQSDILHMIFGDAANAYIPTFKSKEFVEIYLRPLHEIKQISGLTYPQIADLCGVSLSLTEQWFNEKRAVKIRKSYRLLLSLAAFYKSQKLFEFTLNL